MSARYIESTVKDPDVVRFQRNTSRPCVRIIESRRDNRLFHDISRVPIKSRLNEIFGGDELSTCAIVLFLSRAMLYKAGYCSRRLALPSQMSSKNESLTRPLSRKTQSERDVSLPPLGQPKSASRQVSNMPGIPPFGLDTCCATWFAKHHPYSKKFEQPFTK